MMYSSNADKDYEAVKSYHKPHHEYGKSRPDDNYGRKFPVIELEPLMESIPLKRDYMDFGIRGFWVVGEGRSHHSDTDSDKYRVQYHEDVHRRLSRSNPSHPEWEVRMLENWRLGHENYN